MLTPKQQELLLFIHEKLLENGVPPSFDEMRDALDLKSKSGIHRLITALEERGFIRRLAHRARAIEIIKLPDAVIPSTASRGFNPSVIEGSLGKKQADADSTTSSQQKDNDFDLNNNSVTVPVMGRIAAGTPISAIQNQSNTLNVPIDMVGSGEHYALEVRGDSMIEAGILDGDFAIINRRETAENGQIIVALIDDEEATLKKIRKKGGTIALESANENYEPRLLPAYRVKIQGKLVGIIRLYH